jgi:hypothetical protein
MKFGSPTLLHLGRERIKAHFAANVTLSKFYMPNLKLTFLVIQKSSRVIRTPAMLSARCFSLIVG